MQTIFFTKEDGSKEEFLPQKLQASLMKAGADEHTAAGIVKSVMHDITTHEIYEPTAIEIYKKAFHELKQRSVTAAARYSLRRSMHGFGPTGFPFEEFIAEIFKAKGYSTLIDQVVFGSCVPHEVDVIGWKDDELVMVEVKYHNEPAGKTDLKVSLYVKARYDDLKNNMYDYGGEKRKLTEGWLVTNTKFTDTAITYANCNNVQVLSWNYPTVGNLQDLIEEYKLHPVTCLTSLTDAEKKTLLNHKVILCKHIYSNQNILREIGFDDAKIFNIIEEISSILK